MRASFDDDNAWAVNGTVSGPFSDSVRGRVSAYSKKYDGWGKNLYTGHTLNGDDSWGVRAKLDIDVSDRANLLLIGDISAQDRNCCSFMLENLSGNRFYEFDYAQYGITVDEKNNKTLDAQDGFSNTDTYGLSGEVNVDFDKFTLTSITAYRNFKLETNQGIDGFPYDTPTYGRFLFNRNGAYDGGDHSQDQFSEELRINATPTDTVNLTAGLFYWDQTVDRYFTRETYLCTSPAASDTSLSPDPAITPCDAFAHGDGYFKSD